MKNNGFQKDRRSHTVLTVVFTLIAIAYLYPIFIVLVNSLKSNAAINLDTFAFPASDTFMGLQNYIKGMTFGNYPFYRSVEYICGIAKMPMEPNDRVATGSTSPCAT